MKYNNLLQDKINSWDQLEAKIENVTSTKEKGDIFEEFVFVYFNLNKTLYQISEIYMEKDIPLEYREKYKLESRDSGVDGLIILNNGKSAGYQVKFRNGRVKPSYAELTKFWAEARHLDYHYTIANSYELTKLTKKNDKHLAILVEDFEKLNSSFFDEFYHFVNKEKIEKTFFEPFDFQKRMISNVVKGFEDHDRGKLIAACGVGKTFISLKIVEEMGSENILFVAPSLALVKQTLESWASQSKSNFSYLCVCSDRTVSEETDDGDISILNLSVPVTTDSDIISKFLSLDLGKRKIIFSTYHSLNSVVTALKQVDDFIFDLTIFDEAHKTAGAKNSKMFLFGLSDEHLKTKKRLFMTATERLVRPWIIKRAEEYDRVVFSMDDESVYGPVFDRLNFGEAIEKGVISDYRIIVAGIQEQQVYDLIKKDKFLVYDQGDEELFNYAQNIFRQIMLTKAMQEFPIKKVITFHNSIKSAEEFIYGVNGEVFTLQDMIMHFTEDFHEEDWVMDHINGSMSAGIRQEKLDLFEKSKYGIVSNARCLTEGVDVPIIDSIYFVNPKTSLIDIVQACGRALRKPFELPGKKAFFIVPILIPEGEIDGDVINEIDFEMLHYLIQSLRDQDLRLAEWIDEINIHAAKGKTKRISSKPGPIIFDIPENIDLDKFKEKLYLRIAEVNKEPTRVAPKKRKYGKRERKSDYKRIFKTIGDYSVKSYRDSLVMPTLTKFNKPSDALPKEQLAVFKNGKKNHNNISHTIRLGLVSENDGYCKLTPLGIQLYNSEVSFEDLFKNQILRYFEVDKKNDRILFPYRAFLKILLDVKSMNRVEFAFGPYSLLDSSEESINEAVEGINYIRKNYPNIEILNEKNQENVLNELNDYFGTNFSITDIWAGKTTIANQYGYFKNHAVLFHEIEAPRGKDVKIKKGTGTNLKSILKNDNMIGYQKDPKKLNKKFTEKMVIFMLFNL